LRKGDVATAPQCSLLSLELLILSRGCTRGAVHSAAVERPVEGDGIDDSAGATRSPRRRTPRRGVGLVVAALVGLACAYSLAAAALSARDYGTVAFWAAPDRIDYCGRRYYRAPRTVHGTPRFFAARDRGTTAGTTWRMIGRTFALRPIEATVLVHPVNNVLCAGTLFVPSVGRGNYAQYELSGGP
jgi:hypothetical protein